MAPMLAIPVGIPPAVDFSAQIGWLIAVGLLIALAVGVVLVLSSALATERVRGFKGSAERVQGFKGPKVQGFEARRLQRLSTAKGWRTNPVQT